MPKQLISDLIEQEINEESQQKETALFIPFSKIDIAKKCKCFFNPSDKLWYIRNNSKYYNDMIELYSIQNLENIYDNRELYKTNNAKWNHDLKIWQTYNSNSDLYEYFEK